MYPAKLLLLIGVHMCSGWDPEGLFAKSKPLGDVFARKQQGQAASPAPATSPAAAAPAATQTAPSKPAPLPQPAAAAPPPLPAPTAAPSPAPSAATSAASTAAPAAAPRTWPVPIRALHPAAVAAGGVPGNADDAAAGYSRAAFHEQMVSRFIGIDLDYPGLRVLHLVRGLMCQPHAAARRMLARLLRAA